MECNVSNCLQCTEYSQFRCKICDEYFLATDYTCEACVEGYEMTHNGCTLINTRKDTLSFIIGMVIAITSIIGIVTVSIFYYRKSLKNKHTLENQGLLANKSESN